MSSDDTKNQQTVPTEPLFKLATKSPSTTQTTQTTPTLTPNRTTVPTASPTPTYEQAAKGDRSDVISYAQSRLIELGFLAGAADGIFGPATEKAVLLFQESAGYNQTGRLDHDTQVLLFGDAPYKATTDTSVTNRVPTRNPETRTSGYVWVASSGKSYHSSKTCSNMKKPSQISLADALRKGYASCSKCGHLPLAQTVEPAATPTVSPTPPLIDGSREFVWIPRSGKRYHRWSTCSNMKNPRQVTVAEAEKKGFTPCLRCY